MVDVLAIVLPSSAAQLWRDRHRMACLAAWAIWLIELGMTLLAAMGFAATNIGDGVAGRTKVAAEAAGLAADAARLRAERVGIPELRSVATIEAELQRAQPAAAGVWRRAGATRTHDREHQGPAHHGLQYRDITSGVAGDHHVQP